MAIDSVTYKNGKTHCIRNTVDADIDLCKIMAAHNNELKFKPQYKLYMKMANVGLDKFYVELTENCACQNKEKLRKQHYHSRNGNIKQLYCRAKSNRLCY